MQASTGCSQDINHLTFKDDEAHPLSPPPAYTPPRPIDMRVFTARQLAQPRTAHPRPILVNRTPVTSVLADENGSESEEGLSTISLRVNTSVTVASDNNIICLADTPTKNATAIAHAMVKALQESSSGQCGLPMIDEEGRPRPIRVHVDAGVTVRGAGNIIGSETIVQELVRQRRSRDTEATPEEEESHSAKRRRRSQ
ncbi:hypothetical protein HIM_02473 [Hirsutella minnesotensis 3608]|nr:hypothetical protein HIM_02473 [Hirsutella minnesotensis 3608]